MAEQQLDIESKATDNATLGWTVYQFADRAALDGLRKDSGRWQPYNEAGRRQAALDRFHKYAYQWY